MTTTEHALRQAFRAGFARAVASHRDFVQIHPDENEAVEEIMAAITEEAKQ